MVRKRRNPTHPDTRTTEDRLLDKIYRRIKYGRSYTENNTEENTKESNNDDSKDDDKSIEVQIGGDEKSDDTDSIIKLYIAMTTEPERDPLEEPSN